MNPTTVQHSLASLVGEIGRQGFEHRLMQCMHELTGADHCVLISYDASRTAPITLFSSGAIDQPLAQECRRLYDEVYYERDPNRALLDAGTHEPSTQLLTLRPEELSDPEYRRTLIERCGIREKLAFIGHGREQAYCLNLYRLKSRQRKGLLMGALQDNTALIAATLERHISLSTEAQVRFDLPWVRARLSRGCGDRLTQREMDVACRIVLGYSSEAIGLDLGVSVNTVLSHRKNLYEKLGIGTQNQLFAIVTEGRCAWV